MTLRAEVDDEAVQIFSGDVQVATALLFGNRITVTDADGVVLWMHWKWQISFADVDVLGNLAKLEKQLRLVALGNFRRRGY